MSDTATLEAASQVDASNVVVDAELERLAELVGNKQALRAKGADELRREAKELSYRIIFGIFDRKSPHFGGKYVGSAAKSVLKARNGGKNVKSRTVTQSMIAGIKPEEIMAHLVLHRDTAVAGVEAIRKTMEAQETVIRDPQTSQPSIAKAHTPEQIAAHCDKKLKEINKSFEAAQEYINTRWSKIPAAMDLIRAAGNGKVRTDDGEEKPVDLAFEMVLLNRAESAAQFAKHVIAA